MTNRLSMFCLCVVTYPRDIWWFLLHGAIMRILPKCGWKSQKSARLLGYLLVKRSPMQQINQHNLSTLLFKMPFCILSSSQNACMHAYFYACHTNLWNVFLRGVRNIMVAWEKIYISFSFILYFTTTKFHICGCYRLQIRKKWILSGNSISEF